MISFNLDCLQTTVHDGIHLEQGPRSLRGRNALPTFELVTDLGLQERMVVAGGAGPRDLTGSKYFLIGGRLHEIVPNPARLA